jgi:hypothetical protein
MKHTFYIDYTIDTTKQMDAVCTFPNLYIKQPAMVSQYLLLSVTTKQCFTSMSWLYMLHVYKYI